MAMEPITLFARIADPAAVARRLREIAPAVEIDGPDDNSSAHSAAQERHQAANWLREGPERYSEASVAT